jgi:hypothetical protein
LNPQISIGTAVLTMIFVVLLCWLAYLVIKGERALAKVRRRSELEAWLKSDYTVQSAVLTLIRDKIAEDYLLQAALTKFLLTQVEKDWQVKRALGEFVEPKIVSIRRDLKRDVLTELAERERTEIVSKVVQGLIEEIKKDVA